MLRLRCFGLPLAVGLIFASGTGLGVRAETWDRIGSFAATLRRAGTSTLVARDCPSSLLGAFHIQHNALLICANNLPNDPVEIWRVLAHEAAHVMQHCRGGPLLADGQLGRTIARANASSPLLFKALKMYHQSQHRDEVEARLVQTLPADQVEALFARFCADRLASPSEDPAL